MRRFHWAVLIGLSALQTGCVLFDPAGGLKAPQGLPVAESAAACKTVGDNLAAQGHAEQALEQLLKAREYDPAVDVSASLARLYSRLEKDKPARDEFARALEAKPNDAPLWNDLGYHQYQRGNWKEAEESLRKAVALDPKFDKAWMNLGLALGQQEQFPGALDAFEKAVRPAEARSNLAFVMMTKGQYDKAKDLYNEALRLDPGLSVARAALARMEAPARPTE